MASIFHVGHGTLISLTGKDRSLVLNNLTTQDIKQIENGQSLETFITDAKGRCFGHGIVFAWSDRIYFLTVANQASRLLPHIDRYIIREDAVVHDESPIYDWYLFDAEAAVNFLGSWGQSELEIGSCNSSEINGIETIRISISWLGPNSMLLLFPRSNQGKSHELFQNSEVIESDLEHRREWELLRIQSNWPWYGIDFDERNLPQEIDRDAMAISFKKGCYLGQETIARLDALGQIQKKLCRLNVPSEQIQFSEEKIVVLLGENPITAKSFAIHEHRAELFAEVPRKLFGLLA